MKIVRFALLLLLVLGGLTLWTLMHSRSVERRFTHLQTGQDKAHVLEALGNPARSQACKPRIQQASTCASELIYAHPLAPVVPEYWIVSLDAQGKVAALIHTTTP